MDAIAGEFKRENHSLEIGGTEEETLLFLSQTNLDSSRNSFFGLTEPELLPL